jgi:hypothetical protein
MTPELQEIYESLQRVRTETNNCAQHGRALFVPTPTISLLGREGGEREREREREIGREGGRERERGGEEQEFFLFLPLFFDEPKAFLT